MTKPQRIRVGQIVGAFGLKGLVKVVPLTKFDSRFEKGSHLWIDEREFSVEAYSMHKGRPLLKLSGIESMTEAEALQWSFLDSEERLTLAPDEFLVDDLIGLDVYDITGELLGPVKSIDDYPAHQVLVVGDILIPMVKAFVSEINIQEKRIRVQLIPGMRPGEDDEV